MSLKYVLKTAFFWKKGLNSNHKLRKQIFLQYKQQDVSILENFEFIEYYRIVVLISKSALDTAV